MYAHLLLWSFRHRRWRHVLNGIIMATTVAVVMLFVSVTVELVVFARGSADRELTRIAVWPKLAPPGSDNGLPLAFYSVLKQIDGVKVVQRIKAFHGRHESGATYLIVGEEDSGIEMSRDFFPVDPATIEAWKKERPLGAIVSEETAEELKLKVGELAEVPTEFGPLQIKVVGLSKGAKIGHRIATHFEYVQEFSKLVATCGYRVFSTPGDFERVAKAIIEQTKNTSTPAQGFSDSQFTASWARRVAIVPALLGFLGAFLLFTTALTLANNTAISIRERRTETATLRVLGYRKWTIVRLMLGESMLVGLAGGILAIIVSSVVLRGGVQLTPGVERLLQKVTVSPLAMGCGVVLSILVPLVGALPAALAAVRMPLVDALRDTA